MSPFSSIPRVSHPLSAKAREWPRCGSQIENSFFSFRRDQRFDRLYSRRIDGENLVVNAADPVVY